MTAPEALPKVLKPFGVYYKINTETPASPFAAEAVFTAKDEHYAMFRNVKYAEADSAEYVFFALTDRLNTETAEHLSDAAWQEGLSRVTPGPNHRNTDVTLIILAEQVDPDAEDYIKKLRHYKSYKHMFHGWSNYRTVIFETFTGRKASNRLGRDLEKLFDNIPI